LVALFRLLQPAVMFTDLDQARAFERYLKSSPSGRAFAKNRL